MLVLNAHEESKVATAEPWLRTVLPSLPALHRVVLVVHGAETCNNDWLRRYLDDPGLRIGPIFVTYGKPAPLAPSPSTSPAAAG